jgi:hypothetical protein
MPHPFPTGNRNKVSNAFCDESIHSKSGVTYSRQ